MLIDSMNCGDYTGIKKFKVAVLWKNDRINFEKQKGEG